MEKIFGSKTKANILLYLGLRGGCSGRQLARVLKKNPSQIFKALHLLERSKIIKRVDSLYRLNPYYLYYEELLSMIHKTAAHTKFSFLPTIQPDRKIDPFAVYEMLALRGPVLHAVRLSDTLRNQYA